MQLDFTSGVLLVGIAQSLFVATSVFNRPQGSTGANRCLSVLLLSMSFALLTHLLTVTGLWRDWPRGYVLISTSVLLFGPALLFYVRFLSVPGFRLGWSHGLHLMPWLVNLVLLLPLLLLSSEGLVEALGRADDGSVRAMAIPLLKLLTLSAYLALTLRQLRRHRADVRRHYANLDRVSLNWIKTLIISFVSFAVIAVVMMLIDLPSVDSWLSLVLVITAFLVGFFGMQQPQVYAEGDVAPRYESSSLSPEQRTSISRRLDKVVVENQLFEDRFLDLKALANAVGASTHQVSQVLNEQRQQTFYEFVNSQRVVNAQTRLRESNDSILDIALGVGFNNKTTFNKAFKRVTGVTPSEYRRVTGVTHSANRKGDQ